jgi:photosystem II stability/assembly factor-like uncharacterized protein
MKRLILLELILLFLATTFRSDSAGGWVQQILPVNKTINDIFFVDTLTGWVVTPGASSSTDTGYILKTTTGGNDWLIQYNFVMNFNRIQFVDNNTGYAGGGDGLAKLFKTTSGGSSWFLQSSLGFITISDLFFVSRDTGWICDDNPLSGGIFKTTNGGLNWQQQLGASFSIKKLFMLNKDTGWAGSNEPNGKLYRTINGGGNWNLQYTFATGPTDIFFVSKDTGWALAGSTGLMKSIDGGDSWFSQNNPGTIVGESRMFFFDNKRGWVGIFSNRMLATNDGMNWGYQTTPAFSNYHVYFADSVKGWAGSSILIHTTDGGGIISAVNQIGSEIPSYFKLLQNYPNPFNPVTVISYQLRVSSYVKMTVYDIMGKEIAVLVNQKQNPGTYRVDFNGSGYSSGVYFYQLTVENKIVDTKKMVMIK